MYVTLLCASQVLSSTLVFPRELSPFYQLIYKTLHALLHPLIIPKFIIPQWRLEFDNLKLAFIKFERFDSMMTHALGFHRAFDFYEVALRDSFIELVANSITFLGIIERRSLQVEHCGLDFGGFMAFFAWL
jgi:hypothetical protein